MIFLVIYVFITIVSQTILKVESTKKSVSNENNYLLKMMLNAKVIFAYFLSLCNLFIWVFALTKITLLEAVFFTSFSYVLFVLVDKYYFKESINNYKIVGVLFVTIGVLTFVY